MNATFHDQQLAEGLRRGRIEALTRLRNELKDRVFFLEADLKAVETELQLLRYGGTQ